MMAKALKCSEDIDVSGGFLRVADLPAFSRRARTASYRLAVFELQHDCEISSPHLTVDSPVSWGGPQGGAFQSAELQAA